MIGDNSVAGYEKMLKYPVKFRGASVGDDHHREPKIYIKRMMKKSSSRSSPLFSTGMLVLLIRTNSHNIIIRIV